MRLVIFLAITLLSLATLVSAFSQVVATMPDNGRSVNIQDHMMFNRQLATHEARLVVLDRQDAALVMLPERMARIEEKIIMFGRMIYAILAGVFALLAKEVWSGMQSIRSGRKSS